MELASAAGPAAPAHGAHALHHHQPAHRPEYDDVEQRNREIDLPQPPQERKQLHPEHRADRAAGEEHQAHSVIDIAAPALGDQAGDRGADGLIGAGGDGDGRRDPDQQQQRCQQEAAAHPE